MERNSSLRIIHQVFLGRDQDQLMRSFPAIEPSPEAKGTLGVCIGFLVGLSVSGEVTLANEYAESFIKCLSHLNKHEINENRTFSHFSRLYSDGTEMGFSFGKFVYSPDAITDFILVDEKKYTMMYNGGMIFHGLNNQTFSVSLTATNGWQLHT